METLTGPMHVALLTNIRLESECLTVTNALAYYAAEIITVAKSFIKESSHQ